MTQHVLLKCGNLHSSKTAHMTFVWPLSSVDAQVLLQVVTLLESLGAPRPCAVEGSFRLQRKQKDFSTLFSDHLRELQWMH